MKLGLMTGCFGGLSLRETAQWASANGYRALEIASWPAGMASATTAAHIDVEALTERGAAETRAMLDDFGVEPIALAYYANNLDSEPMIRSGSLQHLKRCIEAAALLEVPSVGTFVGRDVTKTLDENVRLTQDLFGPLAEYAAAAGVRLAIENAVVEHWDPDRRLGNIASSTEVWPVLFDLGLWLVFDPSHLHYLGIDPVLAFEFARDRTAYVQAKDVEIFPDGLARWGWPGRMWPATTPFDSGWWRFRVPGRGGIDWSVLMRNLHETGFTGSVVVEAEDPVYGVDVSGNQISLQIAYETLSPLLSWRAEPSEDPSSA